MSATERFKYLSNCSTVMVSEKNISNEKEVNRKMTRFFSSLADETRLKMLLCLTKGKRNVNEIYGCVGRDKMTLSAISHQLRQLSDMNIVVHEKNGKEKEFRLSDEFCWCILKDAYNHFNGKKVKCSRCSELKDKNMKGA